MATVPRVLPIKVTLDTSDFKEQIDKLRPHHVAYAQGEDRVVCSCGAYFTTPTMSSMTGPPTGLAQWARHQARPFDA